MELDGCTWPYSHLTHCEAGKEHDILEGQQTTLHRKQNNLSSYR